MLAAGIGAGMTAACAPLVRYPRLVKLGVVAPFDRYAAEVGYAAYFGARLAVREWNRSRTEGAAGVAYRVELLTQDDQGTASGGALEARKMAADPDVLAVVGHTAPESAVTAAEIYRTAGVPFVSLAAGVPEVDGRLSWQVMPGLADPAWAAADFLAERGVEVGVAPIAATRAIDWMSENPARAVLLVGPAAAPVVAELAPRGVRVFALLPTTPFRSSAEQSFVIPYRESAERREWWLSALVYDATRLVLDAIGRAVDAGRVDRAGVAQGLAESPGLDGVAGELRFDPTGRRTGHNWWLYRVDGDFPGQPIATCPSAAPFRCVPQPA